MGGGPPFTDSSARPDTPRDESFGTGLVGRSTTILYPRPEDKRGRNLESNLVVERDGKILNETLLELKCLFILQVMRIEKRDSVNFCVPLLHPG